MLILRETHIIDVLENCPKAIEVLERHGMDCASCLGADTGTIEDGAMMHSIDVTELLEELNRCCEENK